jgi:ornithine decarboxylase
MSAVERIDRFFARHVPSMPCVISARSACVLPAALEIGDPLDFMTAGAYTASHASVEFNGFPPLTTHCI